MISITCVFIEIILDLKFRLRKYTNVIAYVLVQLEYESGYTIQT